MTEEDRKLLLKDLSARLLYGIICDDGYGNVLELNGIDKPNTATFKCFDKTFWTTDLDKCKPYLFPLSSMTEEQKKYINDRWGINEDFDFEIDPNWGKYFVDLGDVVGYINWLNENHFDYRGLIEKGLAIDATGQNVY